MSDSDLGTHDLSTTEKVEDLNADEASLAQVTGGGTGTTTPVTLTTPPPTGIDEMPRAGRTTLGPRGR